MFPPERIRAIVVPRAEKALGRTVQVQDVGISVFPVLGVNLDGVRIANTEREGFSAEPFVSLERFVVSLELLPLIGGKVSIDRIIVDRPDILIEVDTSGAYNYDDIALLAEAESGDESGPKRPRGAPVVPVPLSLKGFEIRRGRVVYRDMGAGRRIELGRIDQRTDLSIDTDAGEVETTGNMTIREIVLRTAKAPAPVRGLTVTLTHDIAADLTSGTVDVKSVRASLQRLALSMSGTVSGLDGTPTFDMRVDSDTLSMRDIVAEIPKTMVPRIGKLEADGFVRLAMRIAGKLGEGQTPAVRGELRVQDVMIQHADFPQSLNSFNADIAFAPDTLQVRKLGLKLGDNPIALEAAISEFDNPVVDVTLVARADLGAVENMIDLPPGVALGGIVGADLRAKGRMDPSDPSQLMLDGTVELRKVRVTTPELGQPVALDGDVSLSSKRIRSKLGAAVGTSSFSVDATVNDFLSLVVPDSTGKQPRTTVDFDLDSKRLDLDSILAAAHEGGAEDQDTSPDSKASPLLLAAPLPGIDVTGEIRCGQLMYEGIPLKNVKVDIRNRGDAVDVGIRGGLYGGALGVDVHADMRNYRDVGLDLELTTTNVDMNRFVSSFNDRLPETTPLYRALRATDDMVYGKVSCVIDLSGRGGTLEQLQNSLGGTIRASADKGRIQGSRLFRSAGNVLARFAGVEGEIAFRDLELRAALHDGTVNVQDLRIMTSLADIRTDGTVGLDAHYDLEMAWRLNRTVSKELLVMENKGKDALRGLLKGTRVEGLASKMLGRVDAIPSDREGRVTVLVGVKGGMDSPRARFRGFSGAAQGGTRQKKGNPDTQSTGSTPDKTETLGERDGNDVDKQVEQLEDKVTKELEKLW